MPLLKDHLHRRHKEEGQQGGDAESVADGSREWRDRYVRETAVRYSFNDHGASPIHAYPIDDDLLYHGMLSQCREVQGRFCHVERADLFTAFDVRRRRIDQPVCHSPGQIALTLM